MNRFVITLKDVGLRKLFLRLKFEIKKKLYNNLNFIYSKKPKLKTPEFSNILDSLEEKEINVFKDQYELPLNIKFKFLNKEKKLIFPFDWNDKTFPRLWVFNLHYFDWAREWVDNELNNQKINKRKLFFIKILINDWIDNNAIGIGDGWHSYTISLRIRNLIWLYRVFPTLRSKKFIGSLWEQLVWLNRNLEFHHSGNHLIENLISLAIGSLQFQGPESKRFFKKAIFYLKRELSEQILQDGGHEERSSSYHILLLERLIELGCVIQAKTKKKPIWLCKYLLLMLGWLKKIYLIDDNFPVFNDCSKSACDSPKNVVNFCESFLQGKDLCEKNLRSRLLKEANLNFDNKEKINFDLEIKEINNINFKKIVDLKNTGWTILKPNDQIELVFKCGTSCPPHLGAHAHSDQLSFELFFKGEKILNNTGTTTYELSKERLYERSSKAHNVLQLGKQSRKGITWIEPVDVWHRFRAGFKAEPTHRASGEVNDWCWVSGSHNGFDRILSSHKRWVAISSDDFGKPILCVVDLIAAGQNIYWRRFFHIGPGIPDAFSENGLQFRSWEMGTKSEESLLQSYYAKEFGLKKSRKKIYSKGKCLENNVILVSLLCSNKLKTNFRKSSSHNANLLIGNRINIVIKEDDLNPVIVQYDKKTA